MRKKTKLLERFLHTLPKLQYGFLLSAITKIAVLVLGTFLTVPAIAQDYQSILPHRTATYESDGGFMKFVQTDSTKTVGESTTLFLFQNIQETSRESCYVPHGASWIGEKIIINSNGENLFFNRDNDTILIKTQAEKDESWIAYSDTNILVQAEITNHQIMDVLGETDSVKTITFKVYNSELDPIEHILNDKTLRLSKTHGLVTTLNFLRFPDISNWRESLEEYNLVGLSNPATGVQNLTWFDVHDHQPGDELHIEEKKDDGMSGIVHFDYKQFIEKIQERHDHNDSIVYRIERKIRMEEKKFPDTFVQIHFIHDTISRVVKDFHSFDIFPGQALFIDEGLTHFHQKRNKNQIIEKWIEPDFYMPDGVDDCWYQVFLLKGEIPYGSFYKGLGGPYYPDVWGSGSRSLVYYKKGNQTWGTPLVITNVTQGQEDLEIRVFPNPSSDRFYVQIPERSLPARLEVLDVRGRIIHTQTVESERSSIIPGNREPGMYFYRIIRGTEVIKQGKLLLL